MSKSKIPLFLNIKETSQVGGLPLFDVSDKSIKFNEKNYDFTKIFSRDDYSELIEEPKTDSSCFIFMGPTGAGKTTTLRKVIYNKITALQDSKSVTFLTAFEVSGNRYIIDLLERKSSNRKEIQNTISIETKLKKEKLNQDNAGSIISAVFSRRNTRKTSFNDESSRSCLIITFFYNNKRVTYIDLMGNEKFDKSTPTSNIFANSSISSITQLLSKRIVNGRSSNFITNLIFRKDASQHKNIKIILHLDQYGDSSLVKSTLTNIADLLKKFDFDDSLTSKKNSTSHIPNYAKPTVASLSPRKLGLWPSRINSSPSKVKPVTSISSNPKAPKSPVRQNISSKSPSRSTYLKSSPVKLQSSSNEDTLLQSRNNLMNDFHGIQVAGLKKAIEDLEYENSQLKNEHQEILDFFNKNSSEVNADLTIYKENENLDVVALKAELDNLRKMNFETESLEQQKKFLNDKVDEFRIEFYRFKEEHGSFKDKVENLKQTITTLEENTTLLEKSNLSKEEELTKYASGHDDAFKKNHQLELVIEESSAKMESLKGELSKIITSNNELMENHESLKQRYEELQNVQKENEINKDSVITFNEKLEEKETLISELKQKVKKEEEAFLRATSETQEKVKALKEMANVANEKNSEIQKLKSEIKKKDDLITAIKEEIDNLESASSDGNFILEAKEKSLSKAINDINIANEKIDSLQVELEKSEEENANLSKSLKMSGQQILDISNTVNELKEEISYLESKNSELHSQIQDKTSSIASHIEINNELKDLVSNLETKNSDLSVEISDLKKKFDTKESNWSKKLENIESNQSDEVSDLEKNNNSLREELSELEKEIKHREANWSKKLDELENQRNEEINNLEIKNKSLEGKLVDLNNELETKKANWSKRLDDLESSKNDEINELESKLAYSNTIPMDSLDLFNDQLKFPKFKPSDIFEDIKTNTIEDTPIVEALTTDNTSKENTPVETSPKEKQTTDKSPSKKKKILMPSNKTDNYKDKINLMSKDKKLKRKASSHKLKHKHHKSNMSKSQSA